MSASACALGCPCYSPPSRQLLESSHCVVTTNAGSEMDTQLQGPLEKTRSFERFLRKIQGQPNSPAVVMMNVSLTGG